MLWGDEICGNTYIHNKSVMDGKWKPTSVGGMHGGLWAHR